MQAADFAAPIDRRWLEDYVPGTVVAYGSIRVEAADIIDFAQRFDPQEFHLDAERAAEGPFGGLIASGWHTASVMMRMLVDHYLSRVASLGSPGVDELRWLAPVRAGDTLSIRVTVVEARRSQAKPDRGLVRALIEVLNQRDETVMTVRAMTLMRCRDRPPG